MLDFSSDGAFNCKEAYHRLLVYPSSAKHSKNVITNIYIDIYISTLEKVWLMSNFSDLDSCINH